ncbi:MAG: HEPN domain-containing protein [Bacteroidota bacterium]
MKEETRLWINKAIEDFRTAEILINVDDSPPAVICFHCQQSAEKYFKAFLVNKSVEFPRIHDLLELLERLILPADQSFISIREASEILMDYAVAPRYPDYLFDPTRKDAMTAFNALKEIQQFVQQKF